MKKMASGLIKVFGFGFIILGVIICILDRFACSGLFKNCKCDEISSCYFLIFFVGIIFIVDGISILMLKVKKLKR